MSHIRESPALTLARKALGFGCTVRGLTFFATGVLFYDSYDVELDGNTFDHSSAHKRVFGFGVMPACLPHSDHTS